MCEGKKTLVIDSQVFAECDYVILPKSKAKICRVQFAEIYDAVYEMREFSGIPHHRIQISFRDGNLRAVFLPK